MTAGLGVFHDAPNLVLLTRPASGGRTDYFFEPDGQSLRRAPLETIFSIQEAGLHRSRALGWSLGLERRLPGSVDLGLEYQSRQGSGGLAFEKAGMEEAARLLVAKARPPAASKVRPQVARKVRLPAAVARFRENGLKVSDTNISDTKAILANITDPELLKFPIAYLSEPGYWYPSEREAMAGF